MDGKSDERNRILDDLVRRIVARMHPLRVILFGSNARGTARADSDVDLLVVMPEGTHRRHTAQQLYLHLQGARIAFDLLVATPSDLERHKDNPGLIYKQILAEGREVYAA